MRKLFAIILIISTSISFAQINDGDLNDISLSVILPDNSEDLSQRSVSKIESKIQHIVSKYGISGNGYTSEFLIYPKVEIFNESVVEGMRNLVFVEIEFNLFIQQYSTRRIFSSYAKTLKGSGFNKEKAIADAISKIPTNGKYLEEFMIKGKEKILTYYNNNCDQIMLDADYLMKTQKFDQVIAILSTVPKEAKDCYASLQAKSIEAFNLYQKQMCESNLLKAKAELANNNYSGALKYLSLIDASSPCLGNAESLVKEVSRQVDAKEKREWDFVLKKYSDKQNLAKYRLDTMREISKSYYASKPTTVIYKSLF